jgi:acyl-coenzyme A synthetase/AMP-(fatty) acid ligase
MTIFGTSAKYISALDEAGYRPGSDCNLDRLRMICSTGSPLAVSGFEYAYREIKADMQLASISGGTDLNGCFALGNPMLPVHAGELQGPGLGLKVHAFNDAGQPVTDETGELVCTSAFPSMPVYFWNDPDGERYTRPISPSIRGSGPTATSSASTAQPAASPSTAAAMPPSIRGACASAPPISTRPWNPWRR